jgi:hypothetical protein
MTVLNTFVMYPTSTAEMTVPSRNPLIDPKAQSEIMAALKNRVRSKTIFGSEQESDGTRILGCFPEDHEFGLEGGHPLCLQQEVTEIPIATPAAE